MDTQILKYRRLEKKIKNSLGVCLWGFRHSGHVCYFVRRCMALSLLVCSELLWTCAAEILASPVLRYLTNHDGGSNIGPRECAVAGYPIERQAPYRPVSLVRLRWIAPGIIPVNQIIYKLEKQFG